MIRLYLFLFVFFLSFNQVQSQVIAYHPNKHWHVPGQLPKNTGKYPFRYFFPQYSFPRGFNDGKQHASDWREWMKQNNFSHAYPLAGHSWGAVIQRNKEAFQKHPEYLAEVKGVRPGYGKTSKFCVSNKELQQLFIQDRLKAFDELKNPEGSVSVEPSDGAGFCECSECKKLGSISNQVFYLANITAKAIRENYPKGKVNLYAYHQHAQIPDFDLEPNVHVTVIPDGFQGIYDGDVMLALWARKAKLKTYYEYFAIPQWRGEQPRLFMQNFIRRMRLAQNLGYRGYWFEAGLNINAAIALQLFNQMWLNPTLSWEDVSERFLRSSFPGSYKPMKELFTRWWYTWKQDEELPMALYNLQEATKLARSEQEQERINDLKAYVHYLALYQEWNKNRKDAAVTEKLFDYIYQSGSRRIVNASALYQIFASSIPVAKRERYNIFKNKDWRWVDSLTPEQIQKNFAQDLATYGTKQNNFAYVDASKSLGATAKNLPLKSLELNSRQSQKVSFYGEGEINVQLIKPVDIATQNDNALVLSVLSNDGNLITYQRVSYDSPNVKVRLPKAGIYSLSILQFFTTKMKISGKLVPIAN